MKRGLMRHGMILFLLGLLTGFAVAALRNPRSGLAAHLEGLMNGTFLVVAGLVWDELRLGERARKAAYWLLLYGAYANWTGTLLSGVFGASKATPIAGAGFTASPLQENLVFALLVSVGLTMVAALAILVAGLRGARD